MFDAMQMIASREAVAVTGVLDFAGRPDCRGAEFGDPGGWGMIRFDGGLLGMVHASDYGFADGSITVIGTEGRARIADGGVSIQLRGSEVEQWPADSDMTGMGRATSEIVDYLDGKMEFPYDVHEAVRTLEAIDTPAGGGEVLFPGAAGTGKNAGKASGKEAVAE